ncbi:MAG: GTPase HflX [Lachnospiraceae bacterium]|nr:GTPase HflX [Lachnospiraceae bacterium]
MNYDHRAVLVGLQIKQTDDEFYRAMDELELLAKTASVETVLKAVQRLDSPVRATYIGSGKLTEIKAAAADLDADTVIFDQQLTPMQFKNLNEALGVEVLDRTGLILRIFSDQARTREARLQVEHANLQYVLPRLAGMWTHFGRQAGSSGSMSNRGVGETQIELDRRHIERRMAELERELKAIERERATQRERRLRSELPKVALVGYTNAGKSTLMNRLLELSLSPSEVKREEKKVHVKDALFVTLDTTVRKIEPPSGHPFLLSDTVGFINELPASLVKAFRSTLEEVKYADILLQVVDISDPMHDVCEKVTEDTLREIGAAALPMIIVCNKLDKAEDPGLTAKRVRNKVYISADKNEGIDLLLEAIEDEIANMRKECALLLPYDKGSLLHRLQENGDVVSSEYRPDGVLVKAVVRKEYIKYLKSFMVEE